MRTITKTIECYTFDELSDKAKDNVKGRLCVEYAWFDEAMDSLRAFAYEIGIVIIDYSIDVGCSAQSHVRWDGIPHSRFIKEDLTGTFTDYPLSKTWNKTRDIDECIVRWLSDIENDYLSQWDDEYVEDMCLSNEYEFTKEGELL